MKKVLAVVLAVVMLASFSGVALAGQGNDLPSGPHYNLNLLGKDKDMPQDDCEGGNRIFVNLYGNTRINLVEGDDFAVTDCDGTSGPAEFTLPNPDPNNTGTTEYSVFVRLRGKPNGDIIMVTCGTYKDPEYVYCSDLKVIEVRETGPGKNKFNNVSKELLYIYAWVCTAGTPPDECTNWEYMRVPLFDDAWEDFFWSLDNNGVRVVQLRFYPGVQTRVPDVVQIDPRKAFASTVQVDVAAQITSLDAAVDFTVGATPDVWDDDIIIDDIVVHDASTINCTLEIPALADPGTRLIWVSHEGTLYLTSFEVK